MLLVSVVTLAVRVPSEPSDGVTVPMLWISVRSTSVKVIVPLSARLPDGVTCSAMVPMRSCVATTGASFVPVMPTTKFLVATPLLPSSTVSV